MQTSWTEYFMDLAKAVSTRSTCLRRKVGAVAVNPRHMVIGTGYNGAPSSMAHCTPETCIRVKNHIPSGEKLEMCKAVHAEQNLVVRLGDKLENATIYITTRPCTTCTKLLIQAGVKEIVWDKDYDDTYATNLLQEYFNNTITIDEFGYKHITKSIS